jgi:aminoglycoside phosphotransferase (APT) family kinase protein
MAVATASGAVLRLGTSPDVFERYQKEWRVLPWLRGKDLPVAIPSPRWLLEPGGSFPFGGIGYPLIEGRVLTQADVDGPHRHALSRQIAELNLALHRLPIEEARGLGVPLGTDLKAYWDDLDRTASLAALENALSPAEFAVIEAWWRRYLDATPTDAAPVFVHGDIGDENLLVTPDGSRIIGVIDFEHCAVGDPLEDFDNLYYLGVPFQLETMAEYERIGGQLPPGFEATLELRRQRGAFPGVRREWLRGSPLESSAARERLRAYGIL